MTPKNTKREWDWRTYFLRSIFSGEQVGIKKILRIEPKRQCCIEWKHIEKVIEEILHQELKKFAKEVEDYIKNTLILMNINHGPVRMRGKWINKEDLEKKIKEALKRRGIK